ncbi:Hint domain-containing protein [Micromonospora sp. DT233]|uniref:Hint domain-containing protein n=1 Tax=Micromonospora sp. DT233 TaxID=3393432 RepID=UPI003CEADFD7
MPGGIPDYVLATGYRDADGVFTWGEAYEWAAQDPAHGSYACYHMLGLPESTCSSVNWKSNSGGLAGVVAVILVAGTAACLVVGPECWAAAGVVLTRIAVSAGGRFAASAAAGAGEFAAGGSLLGAAGTGALTGYSLFAASAAGRAGAACSFAGDTPVLLADGNTKPISELKVGDLLAVADPETGEVGQEAVSNVWVHEDNIHILDVGGKPLSTTEDHPYWNMISESGEVLASKIAKQVPQSAIVKAYQYMEIPPP